MKILPCTQCQHYIKSERHPEVYSKCGHPDTQIVNFVTGKSESQPCYQVRLYSGACSHEGKLWAYDDAFPLAEEYSNEI